MASWKKYFRPVNSVLPVHDAEYSGATSVSKYSSWLPEVYQGPPNRLERYIQYEQMDLDHEVHAALDTLAEFSTQCDKRTGLPFSFSYDPDIELTETEVKILNSQLKKWCKLNQFSKRIFRMFRSTLLYGDQFFIRDPETYKLHWIDPSSIEKILVNESEGKKPEIYYVKDLDLNLATLTATNTNLQGQDGYGFFNRSSQQPVTANKVNHSNNSVGNGEHSGMGAGNQGQSVTPVDAKHVVHVSLTEGLDNFWPFGISTLESIFKIYKQKELLEDSVLIYRVHRAPERRVFFIDIGTMPPNKAQQYLERIKHEVQQKRIPSRTGGGQNIVDSAYNPMSMLEDYFFAQTADGRGSKVDTLPGGENLGEIDDLRYFNNKMLRALGVPSAYLPTGPEDGTNSYNDGRVGTAFIQEFRFSKKCERYQNQIIEYLDKEFKMFLKHNDIQIDTSIFGLSFNEPQNFSKYRQIELDSAMTSNFGAVVEVPFVSNRMALTKYLGWTHEEVLQNEKYWREENGKDNAGNDNVSVGDVGVNTNFNADEFDELEAAEEEGMDTDAPPADDAGGVENEE